MFLEAEVRKAGERPIKGGARGQKGLLSTYQAQPLTIVGTAEAVGGVSSTTEDEEGI